MFVCLHLQPFARQLEVFAVKLHPLPVDLLHCGVSAVHQLEARHVGSKLLELGDVQVQETLNKHLWSTR